MARTSYRPLAGCKLFHDAQLRPAGRGLVTVPLRGVSCFFFAASAAYGGVVVTVPLRGVSCFSNSIQHLRGMVNCICSALIGRPIS